MRISDWSSDVCSSDLIRPIIAVIGLMRDMVQRYAGAATFCGVAGAGKRAQGHAMEAVAEGNDQFAARHLASQLDRGFDGIGARRSGEHHALIELARYQD